VSGPQYSLPSARLSSTACPMRMCRGKKHRRYPTVAHHNRLEVLMKARRNARDGDRQSMHQYLALDHTRLNRSVPSWLRFSRWLRASRVLRWSKDLRQMSLEVAQQIVLRSTRELLDSECHHHECRKPRRVRSAPLLPIAHRIPNISRNAERKKFSQDCRLS